MNLTFFETEKWQQEYLRPRLKGQSLKFYIKPLTEEIISSIKDTDVLVVFVHSPVNRQIISRLPRLRLITTMSTGFDHIDLKAAKEHEVTVCNVPFYGENTVAEHAMALMLSITRRIHQSYERTARGNFSNEGLRGIDLKGKTLGVIGTGHIGRHVIRMAKGFEMKIIAYDAYPDTKAAKHLGFHYVKLPELFKEADIITLHAPYNPKTHHLINSQSFKLMKPGVILINTARGGLIDTAAMVKALEAGKVGGLGLDVLEDEQDIMEEAEMLSRHFTKKDLKINVENHILMHSDKAVLTPHNAFNSQEAVERILDTTILNIEHFLGKKKLENQVK
ncbi:MAG: hydroxyacid dehydrogenase [Candidatus Komeilibacteria bacterium]